jgi:hypothetical protein
MSPESSLTPKFFPRAASFLPDAIALLTPDSRVL